MTKVFIYKGVIGIQSSEDSEALITKPGNGNLGCICDASKVQISHDALDALRKIRKGKDGLGEIEVFYGTDTVIFGWLGGYLKAFKPEEIETSRDYDPSLLTSVDGVETPQEFKDFINSYEH